MSAPVLVLGTAERDRQWVSTLTKAQYRWANDRWESRRNNKTVWYPVYVIGSDQVDVRAYSSEKFQEVP